MDRIIRGIKNPSYKKRNLYKNLKKIKIQQFLCRLRVTPLGFCLKAIVNEILINLEKTTSKWSDLLF